MKNDVSFVPVKKILRIINSCETTKQMRGCKKIIDLYIKYADKKGVTNTDQLAQRLMEEYNNKKFQLKMIKSFIKNYEEEYKDILVSAAV